MIPLLQSLFMGAVQIFVDKEARKANLKSATTVASAGTGAALLGSLALPPETFTADPTEAQLILAIVTVVLFFLRKAT